MSSSQIGKTEIELNVAGYHIAQEPSPILVVLPRVEDGKGWSKRRLAPMIEITPALRAVVTEKKSRDSANTIQEKEFPGGLIRIAGSNSPAGLASDPMRILIGDEIDRFAESAGTEGDPIDLARKRLTRYRTTIGALEVYVSTPTNRRQSRIETAFLEGDQRYYWIPCPNCGAFFPLSQPGTIAADDVSSGTPKAAWNLVQWSQNAEGDHDPQTAVFACPDCDAELDDLRRWRAVNEGEWRASKPFNGTASFHCWEAISTWVALSSTVSDFLKAKPYPERLQVWTNTALGETWEIKGDTAPTGLAARRERYAAEVPHLVVLLLASVDVQDDRLELEVVGLSEKEESFGIAHHVFTGDPGKIKSGPGEAPTVWEDLDAQLFRQYTHESGLRMRISATAIDSGGHYTDEVYRYCGRRKARRVYAMKGFDSSRVSFLGILNDKPSRSNKRRVPLYRYSADRAKARVHGRLRIAEPGAGYCHFPLDYTDEFFAQLGAEKRQRKLSKGRAKYVWIKTRERNEALDLRVLSLCAQLILNPNLKQIAAKLRLAAQRVTESSSSIEEAPKPDPPDDDTPPAAPPDMAERERKARPSRNRKRKRRGFVDDWRRH